jgi:rhodanese-related sulfurtransferase
MGSSVTETAPADSAVALAHFENLFRLETDCWDVNDAVSNGRQDFTLLDVRSPDLYANGHAPGAVNIPHRNGAARAAVRLTRLGRPVKLMIGGMTGWLDEGFRTESGPTASAAACG